MHGIDQFRNGGQKKNSSRHVAMATDFFLNNANGSSNHHTKFENFPVYYGFYKKSSNMRFFHRFCIMVGMLGFL